MKHILLVWTDDIFNQLLTFWISQRGKNKVSKITSLPDWDKALAGGEVNTYDHIIILAELAWGREKRSGFRGFDLLEELRIQRVTAPVSICSMLPRSFFLSQKKLIFSILRTPCHHYIQLPAKEAFSRLQTVRLTVSLLEDITYYCLNPIGRVDEIMHNLKNRISRDPEVEVNRSFQELEPLIPSGYHDYLGEIKQQFINQIKSSRETPPMRLVSIYKELIQGLFASGADEPGQLIPVISWRVLYIEDEQEVSKVFKKRLTERGISCITVESGEEAFLTLEKDQKGELVGEDGRLLPRNTITVVISDLRLQDETGEWHYWQGYDIIERIFLKMPNLTAFFVLTSKKGGIMRNVRNDKQVNIHWFAKEDVMVSRNGFNIFAEKVREEGKRMCEALYSCPQEGYWNKVWKNKIEFPLSVFYRYHRLSGNYHIKEKEINELAEDYIRQAEYIESREFNGRIQAKKLALMTGIKYRPEDDEREMEKFYQKLIGRRIAIGLHLKGWHTDDIASILRFRHLNEIPKNIKNLFNSYLCLSLNLDNDIPGKLLVEERAWITYKLGVSIDAPDKLFFRRISKIIEGVQVHLEKIVGSGENDAFFEIDAIGDMEKAILSLTWANDLTKRFGSHRNIFLTELDMLLRDKKFQQSIKLNRMESFLENLIT